MIFEPQKDLLERKEKLQWTNRELANAMNVTPNVASSKLNGFTILTHGERTRLETILSEAEHVLEIANSKDGKPKILSLRQYGLLTPKQQFAFTNTPGATVIPGVAKNYEA